MLRTLALIFGVGWAGFAAVSAAETDEIPPAPLVPPSPTTEDTTVTEDVPVEAMGTATIQLAPPDEVFATTVVDDKTNTENNKQK